MPYKNGKWVLGEEAYKVLMEEEQDEHQLISAFIKEGDLEEGDQLRDLWQQGTVDDYEKTDWETQFGSNWSRRYSILQEYAKDHDIQLPVNDQGLDLQRKNLDDDDFEYDNDKLIMSKMMGDGDYGVDYAHYNSNLAYRSTISEMQAEFTDMRADFTSVRQIRNAQRILRKDGYVVDEEWTKQNAMPYTAGEIEALEDFKKHNITRHFDKEYKITTYLDPKDSRALNLKLYDARKAGNYTRMEEPAAPEWLNIVGGTAPKEEYDSEGQRIIAEGDVRALYQRYLGRDYNKVVDKNIDPSDPTHDPDAIGEDEIAHWEAAALHNDWSYDDVVQELKSSAEGLQNKDRGRIFYNPNFDKEAKISAKLVDEPDAITPPSLTIRQLKGGIQKPSKQAGHSSNLDGFNVKKPVTGEAL